jgi:arylsulfatase A-like enzyme/predicted Zn-dependent protease
VALTRRTFLALILLLGGAALAAWFFRRPAAQPGALRNLNVILITIDTLRADHVGAYGKGRASTPHLDRLAREGALFERCIAQTPLTLPSHATLLSGTYPLHHQVRDNGASLVPPELTLLSEVLKDKGYATGAFIGAYVLDSKWGLDRGFDVYRDDLDRSRYQRLLLQNEKKAEEVVAQARAWIETIQARRFFAWIHLYDPHAPYKAPPPFNRHPDAPYRDEVEYVDHVLGELFDFLERTGVAERSLLVVTSDHGEGLGEHGEDEHGFFLYESTLRVPLLLRAPVPFPVKRVQELVELTDLAPTILDALAIPAPAETQGRSLLPLLFGKDREGVPTAYAETYYPRLHYGWSELQAFYREDWKYVQAPKPELYRLSEDIGETTNLAARFETERTRLERNIASFVASRSEKALSPDTARLTPDEIARLRSLGYVTTRVETGKGSKLPDPKDKIEVYRALLRAQEDLGAGRWNEAIAAARSALSSEPDLLEAQVLLGNALQRKGDLKEAVTVFSRILELKPDANFTMVDLVSALINLGELERASDAARRFLEQFPEDPVLLEELGVARLYLRDYPGALSAFERAIAVEPGTFTLTKAGEVLAIQKEFDRAETYLKRALEINPRARETHYVLAQIAEARGDSAAAKAHYREELEIDPQNVKAAYNLAVIHKREGDFDSALRYYRKTLEANPSFNLPYFMIASLLLERGGDSSEAIGLCERGIAAMPKDRSALLGYQILVRIYGERGDSAKVQLYNRRANALMRALGEVP